MPKKAKSKRASKPKPSISISVKQVMNEKPDIAKLKDARGVDTVMIRPGKAPETFNPYSVFRGPQIHYAFPAPQAYANAPYAVRPIIPARDFIEYSRREPFQTDLRVDTNPKEVTPAMPTVRAMPSKPVVESSRGPSDDDFLSSPIIMDRNIHQQASSQSRAIPSVPDDQSLYAQMMESGAKEADVLESGLEQVEYDAPRLLGNAPPGATFKAVRPLKQGGMVNKDNFGSAFLSWGPNGSTVNPARMGL